ncbi:MAG: hypothetical protein PHV24_04585 [Candidatus Kapabacteria bacterium]|nr:hypothetical protein [Candidatus Kapabacteria bacterium]
MKHFINNSKLLKSISNVVFSKSFLGAMFFATALWAYTSLNQEYRTTISIPLNITLPGNRAFSSAPPENLTLVVNGSGWQIFNLMLNSSAICNIDLTRSMINDSKYEITRDNILKNVKYLDYVQATDIIPDNIKISTGSVGEYSIPIKPNFRISLRKGYIIVGEAKMMPDMVTIKGNDEIAKKIKQWFSKEILLDDVYEPVSTIVEVSDSLDGVVKVLPKQVKLQLDVQQEAELVVPDVKLRVRGGMYMKNDIIEPQTVTVTVRGGIDVIRHLSPDEIDAYVEFHKVVEDSTGILIPVVTSPESVVVLRVDPPYVFHKVRVQEKK